MTLLCTYSILNYTVYTLNASSLSNFRSRNIYKQNYLFNQLCRHFSIYYEIFFHIKNKYLRFKTTKF